MSFPTDARHAAVTWAFWGVPTPWARSSHEPQPDTRMCSCAHDPRRDPASLPAPGPHGVGCDPRRRDPAGSPRWTARSSTAAGTASSTAALVTSASTATPCSTSPAPSGCRLSRSAPSSCCPTCTRATRSSRCPPGRTGANWAALAPYMLNAQVKAINTLAAKRSPVSKQKIAAVFSLGDDADNAQYNEMRLTTEILAGRRLVDTNSGGPGHDNRNEIEPHGVRLAAQPRRRTAHQRPREPALLRRRTPLPRRQGHPLVRRPRQPQHEGDGRHPAHRRRVARSRTQVGGRRLCASPD